MKLLENQSSVTEGEEVHESNKRVPTKSKLYDEFECSSDSDHDIPPVPVCKPGKKIFTDLKPVSLSSHSSTVSLPPFKATVEQFQDCSNKASYLLKNARNNDSCSTNKSVNSTSGSLHGSASKVESSSSSNSHNCHCKDIEGILMNIAGSIEGIKCDMKYLMLTIQQQNTENIILPSTVQPCTSNYELQELDDSLKDIEKFNAMSVALQTIGGRDAVDTTRRILSKLLTNELTISYNWTGRNGKENFGNLKNLNTLILVSVRKNSLSKNATQREVEDITKIFLRNAGDRDGGRERRKNK
ncbi:uncharacterized protein [Leptinotarsa decemlineata]|uniref:uncharacterized protein n=1 Tax=Leptinotarsa decemlineata TaxID=7539 RepID=UPI003D304F73